jgi:hypothetical protein
VQDSVIASFLGLTPEQMGAGMTELIATRFTAQPNLRTFIVDGTGHGLFGNVYGIQQNGVGLSDWVWYMKSGSSSWTNVAP